MLRSLWMLFRKIAKDSYVNTESKNEKKNYEHVERFESILRKKEYGRSNGKNNYSTNRKKQWWKWNNSESRDSEIKTRVEGYNWLPDVARSTESKWMSAASLPVEISLWRSATLKLAFLFNWILSEGHRPKTSVSTYSKVYPLSNSPPHLFMISYIRTTVCSAVAWITVTTPTQKSWPAVIHTDGSGCFYMLQFLSSILYFAFILQYVGSK